MSCLVPCSLNLAKCVAEEAYPILGATIGFFGMGAAEFKLANRLHETLKIYQVSALVDNLVFTGVVLGLPVCTEQLLNYSGLTNCGFGTASFGYFVSSMAPYRLDESYYFLKSGTGYFGGVLLANVVNETIFNISNPVLNAVATNALCFATSSGVAFLTRKVVQLKGKLL